MNVQSHACIGGKHVGDDIRRLQIVFKLCRELLDV